MKKHEILPALLIALIVALAGMGVNRAGVMVFGVFSVAIFITYYFNSRQNEIPSTTEKIAANCWLFIRRLVCFVAALPFAGVAIQEMYSDNTLFEKIKISGLLLIVSTALLWVGVYGQGNNRYSLKDDVNLHKKNKERYKWRW